jgi:hypothetical protein
MSGRVIPNRRRESGQELPTMDNQSIDESVGSAAPCFRHLKLELPVKEACLHAQCPWHQPFPIWSRPRSEMIPYSIDPQCRSRTVHHRVLFSRLSAGRHWYIRLYFHEWRIRSKRESLWGAEQEWVDLQGRVHWRRGCRSNRIYH